MEKAEFLRPVANTYRRRIDLSGSWYFAFDGAKDRNYENGVPRRMTIPVPSAMQDCFVAPNERFFCGTMWYETMAFVPKAWLGDDVFLRFEGIGQRAVIYVNGIEAGRHEGAYTPAIVSITRQLRYGEENRIVVKVNNEMSMYSLPAGHTCSLPDGRKANVSDAPYEVPAGLFGAVSMYTVPTTRLVDVFIQTTELTPERAVIHYVAQVQGNCLVTVTLRDRDGRVVATGVGGNAKLTVENPHVWSIGSGYLYTMELEVSRLGKQHDMYSVRFGIRTVAVKGGQLLLNGEPITIKGVHVKAGFGDSLTYSAPQAKQRLLQIAALGGNCVFSGGRPLPENVLSMADECGLMVIDEIPAVGLGLTSANNGDAHYARADMRSRALEAHKEAIRRLVHRDKNHTSVVCWSLMYKPTSLTNEDATYFEGIFDQLLQSDWEGRPWVMTVGQMPTSISGTILEKCKLMIVASGEDVWGHAAVAVQDALYKTIMEWQTKAPDVGVVALLGKEDNRGAHLTWQTQSSLTDMYQSLLVMLGAMPNVRGALIYEDAFALGKEALKSW